MRVSCAVTCIGTSWLTPPESAPLLDAAVAGEQGGQSRREDQSFFSSLTHPPRKLNGLEKILIGLSVVLLVLASTFIGLFAGAETQLKKEAGRDGGSTVTATVTATKTSGMVTTTISTAPTGKPTQVSGSLRS